MNCRSLRLFIVILLVSAFVIACSDADDNGEPDADLASDVATDDDVEQMDATAPDAEADGGNFEGEICPEDGSFDHLDDGQCSDGEGESMPCAAGHWCLASDHCVGQGGVGAPEECRVMNCGVIECSEQCECIGDSTCVCSDD